MITGLIPDDAAGAAGLMERRRRAYERYSPVFWRPEWHTGWPVAPDGS